MYISIYTPQYTKTNIYIYIWKSPQPLHAPAAMASEYSGFPGGTCPGLVYVSGNWFNLPKQAI